MSAGPWTLFDKFVWTNSVDAGGNLLTEDIYCAICGNSQALSAAFVGASGDARYTDLTDQLATANGYTAGGIILPAKVITNDGDYNTLSADAWEWTISPSVTARYAVLFLNSRPNKDLVAFCDLDSTGTGPVTALGILRFTPDPLGIIKWRQP